METFRLEFLDGFSGDLVVVRIEGREAYRAHPRNRDRTSIRLPDRKPRFTLDVQIPARGVFSSFGLDAPAVEAGLCVWLEPSGIVGFRIGPPEDGGKR